MSLLLGIALVSAASLAFEVILTRIFAIAQGYHFGFLAISLALLGLGASGTLLALRPTPVRETTLPHLARLSLLFSVSLIASYLAINHLPFDSYRVAWERAQLLYLFLYYLALVAPFLLGGLVLGLPLAAFPTRTARIYAANLAGSGLGCIAGLGALAIFGGSGAVIFSALLGILGALAFSMTNRLIVLRRVSCALAAVLGLLLVAPSSFFDLQTSPYKGLCQTLRFPDARVDFQAWNTFSRVDVVKSTAVRSAPGLSLTYLGSMPAQRGLFQDAESLSPLTDTAPPELLDALPVTLAYHLRPNARILMLRPGGGLELLAALNAGAQQIVAVEENPIVVDAQHQFAPHAFDDPRVQLISEGTRAFAARSRDKFDVVHVVLDDSFRPVTAGAYGLSENYVYTVEAFRDYVSLLNDAGILVVTRWLQLPPSEEVRAGALAIAALDTLSPGENILALRSFSTLLLLVKRTPFTEPEIELAKAFAEKRQFDWVALPGLRADQCNRFNVLREEEYCAAFRQLLDPSHRIQFMASYAYDITPPTDDRPFFFHFFKWEQTALAVQLLGKMWQPFGGSGYLILLALLAVSVTASVVLILWPLLGMRPAGRLGRRTALIYFACLGAAFLFVEIPLIQRFGLFLDYPVYAFATVVCVLLLASGLGSFVSMRLPHRPMLALLVVAVLIYPILLPAIFQMFLGYALAGRFAISIILLAPMGFLMGIPFPKGLALLNSQAPRLVPLAWGVNGCASVVSSILAAIGAMTWGFTVVLLAGAGAYAVALISLVSMGRKSPP